MGKHEMKKKEMRKMFKFHKIETGALRGWH